MDAFWEAQVMEGEERARKEYLFMVREIRTPSERRNSPKKEGKGDYHDTKLLNLKKDSLSERVERGRSPGEVIQER